MKGAAAVRALSALTEAARLRDAKPPVDPAVLGMLFDSSDAAIRRAAVQLAGAWKAAPLVSRLTALAAGEDRAVVFAALRDIGGNAVVSALTKLVAADSSVSPEVRREAVVVLAALNANAALPAVVATLRATTGEAEAQALWRALLGIRGFSAKLAAELPKAELPAAAARAGLRPAREGTQHQALVPVLLKAAGLSVAGAQLSVDEMRALAQEALAKGDPARGEALYRREELACVSCHAIGGAGGKLGPDLTSIGASAPADYLVEALLYPNAKIKEGYHSVLLSTTDGREFSGMITRETETEILLRDAANQVVSVPAKSVARRTSVGSLMPAGLLDSLLPEERLDLFRFLAQLGKPGEFDAARGGVARLWKLYLITSGNQHLGSERVVAGDFTLPGWATALSLTGGALPGSEVEKSFGQRGNSRGLFAATQFESARGGEVRFTLTGGAAGAWLNGEIVRPGETFTVTARPGLNTLVLQLNSARPPALLRLAANDVAFRTE